MERGRKTQKQADKRARYEGREDVRSGLGAAEAAGLLLSTSTWTAL